MISIRLLKTTEHGREGFITTTSSSDTTSLPGLPPLSWLSQVARLTGRKLLALFPRSTLLLSRVRVPFRVGSTVRPSRDCIFPQVRVTSFSSMDYMGVPDEYPTCRRYRSYSRRHGLLCSAPLPSTLSTLNPLNRVRPPRFFPQVCDIVTSMV